jgi:vitamin B12 transporter
MKLHLLAPSLVLLSWGIEPIARAQTNALTTTDINQTDTSANAQPEPSVIKSTPKALPSEAPNLDIPRLSDFERLHTSAKLLVQQPTQSKPSLIQTTEDTQPNSPINETAPNATEVEEEIEIVITGEQDIIPQTSAPEYTITEQEIQKQGADSAAEVLKGLPGFAINDFGFGADIHTGTYYRGASINQSVFLINGRPIGTNINIYHGATDLNSLPVGAIEQVELSSGTSSTLYGSEAFGGVVNITTKQGQEVPKLNLSVQYGSYEQLNYRASYGGSTGSLRFNFGYEQNQADNRYRVPVGAANRDSEGRLFNGDTAVSNYFGSLALDLNPRNTISLDAYKITSRRGLLYFGFPLQTDRLDHDGLNVGLSWKTLLGGGDDSVLRTTLAYNQDYFNTYGPTQSIYYLTGTLNSQSLTGRVEHQWQIIPNPGWLPPLSRRVISKKVIAKT